MEIHADITPSITTQSYQPSNQIADIELISLPVMQDDGGYFAELARLDNGNLTAFSRPIPVKQISISQLQPGTIKAYHLHKMQTDVWFVPPQFSMIVNLHDVRAESATYNTHMRLVLGGANPQLLAIPPGIAHGIANLAPTAANLIYYTSEQFNKENPDEHRLPWDFFGSNVWEVTKG
ncbi:MAG: dTDP-4-dehydrorhamnose 3,5-epimerase family protein [bacterium]|nr:dTDP-4-dehydrorhamnose 3,5-epimerase family protein [bacterium]